MLVLALDTSSPAVTAGLVRLTPDGAQVLAEQVVVDARRHGELLAQGVRAVLSGTSPDAVVVGTGPGPFTGLRVGLMTAAAMADALGVAAYGVCSLDAVEMPPGEVVVAGDARRKEVYWARYRDGVRIEGPDVSRPADLAARLSPPVRLVGAGAVLHREAFAELDVLDGASYPSALRLVERAAQRVLSGADGDPLTPLYLRRPDAVEPGAGKKVTAGGAGVSDTRIWLDAFPHDFTAAHERTLRGLSKVPERVYYPGARRDGGRDGAWLRITAATGRVWTGVFASDLVAGRLSVIASWPHPSMLFVAVGGPPYLVDTRDPDRWSRIDRPTVRHFEPLPDVGLCLLLDDQALSAYDAAGLAWESDPLGADAQWLGRLDDEVHLRAGAVLHRVSLRHGGTTSEAASW